jgi:hypothetical protein
MSQGVSGKRVEAWPASKCHSLSSCRVFPKKRRLSQAASLSRSGNFLAEDKFLDSVKRPRRWRLGFCSEASAGHPVPNRSWSNALASQNLRFGTRVADYRITLHPNDNTFKCAYKLLPVVRATIPDGPRSIPSRRSCCASICLLRPPWPPALDGLQLS